MDENALIVRRAVVEDLETVAALFDEYRCFYRQSADREGAMAFIGTRLQVGDSVVLLALVGAQASGFVQLYPSLSSVSMRRIFVLNDLYVRPAARRLGVATALMLEAEKVAGDAGVVRLDLATETTNSAGQALYEKLGWHRDEDYFHYGKKL